MASPTEAEVKTQFANAVRILEQFRKFAATHVAAGSAVNVGDNFLNMEDTLAQSFESDYAPEMARELLQFRNALASAIGRAPQMLYPFLLTYGQIVDAPEADALSLVQRLYQYYVDNTLRVTSRQFVFGTPAAGGSNVGNGTLHRLNKDENNFDIEAQTPDAKIVECFADEHSGATEHEEQFEIRGGDPMRDLLKITGSGKKSVLKALSGVDSSKFIGNPSFSDFSGTITALTAITDWRVGTALSSFNLDQTNFYRDFNGDVTPASLKFLTNDSVEQNLNVRRARLARNVPMYLQIAFNRSIGACDGTLTITMGSQTESVVLAAQSGWTILRIAVGQKNWLKTFNQENPLIKIALTGRTTGTLLVDDVIFAPFQFFDGGWYAMLGGSTPFLIRDKFTFADTETGSILQHWFWRSFGFYLPHTTGGGVTWAEPAN